jgi:hypothetical protein
MGISFISDSTDGTWTDGSIAPQKRGLSKRTIGGVPDFGDLFKFAPFESGHCFLIIFSSPSSEIIGIDDNLTKLFVHSLEFDFRGLTGINDKSGEGHDYGPSSAPFNLISKVEGMGYTSISMTVTERTGTPITKYVSEYLDAIRHPYTQAKNYNGTLGFSNDLYDANFNNEVFQMLYVITDATCLRVEKAFFLLNAQPTTAVYSDLYNMNKGEIGTNDIVVTFNCIVRECAQANKVAQQYLNVLIKNAENKNGKVNLNSYEKDWSVSIKGDVMASSDLVDDLSVDDYISYKSGNNVYFGDDTTTTTTTTDTAEGG